MPVNQPPISRDIVLSSWQYEVTDTLNSVEQTQRLRVLSGPVADRPESAELGTEYFATDEDRWYKYGTSWITIGG